MPKSLNDDTVLHDLTSPVPFDQVRDVRHAWPASKNRKYFNFTLCFISSTYKIFHKFEVYLEIENIES